MYVLALGRTYSTVKLSKGCDPPYQSSTMWAAIEARFIQDLTHHIADPGATMTFVAGGALKPIGGHILSHASATRMFLRKGECIPFVFMFANHESVTASGRAEERVAKLVDSPDRPESEASYKLDEGGWSDVWMPIAWYHQICMPFILLLSSRITAVLNLGFRAKTNLVEWDPIQSNLSKSVASVTVLNALLLLLLFSSIML